MNSRNPIFPKMWNDLIQREALVFDYRVSFAVECDAGKLCGAFVGDRQCSGDSGHQAVAVLSAKRRHDQATLLRLRLACRSINSLIERLERIEPSGFSSNRCFGFSATCGVFAIHGREAQA